MTLRGWICSLFLASMAWAQTAKPAAPPAPPKVSSTPGAAASTAGAATVARDAAVITIPGMCDKPPVTKSAAAPCQTVVTRAEFEQLVDAVAPTIAAPARKQLATQYAVALVMVHKAHEMGLDQGPKFQQLMKVARVGVLTKELSQSLQEEAGHISDKDIESYYHDNQSTFQEADLQRIFIPRSKQVAEGKDKPSADAAKLQQESEGVMKKEAETVRARAAAGEDFEKLQEEALAAAELKGKPPTQLGKIRRSSLPPDQGEVFNLKPGEVSQLLTMPSGYVVYKVGEKDTLPLEKVREEILSTLRSQHMQDALQAIQQSATPELNEKYFADAPVAAPRGKAPEEGAAKAPAKAAESGPK